MQKARAFMEYKILDDQPAAPNLLLRVGNVGGLDKDWWRWKNSGKSVCIPCARGKLLEKGTRYILGIDPGLTGGIAIVDSIDGSLVAAFGLSERNLIGTRTKHNMAKMRNALGPYLHNIGLAVLERVHSSPQMGVVSAFTFGQGYGALEGVLEYLELRVMLTFPSTWKPAMGLDRDKQKSLDMAAKLWPSRYDDLWRLKKNDGIAEAALLAEFGRRTVYNNKNIGIENFQDLL